MKVLILVLCALAATSIQAGKLQDIIGKVKTEFEHLKEIAALIKGGAKPIDVLKEVLKDHPGLKPKLQKACESKLAKLIPGAQAACDAINQPDTAPAPVDPVDATAPVSKRGLEDIFSKVVGELKEKLNGLLQILHLQPKPSVAVSKRGLEDIFGKVIGELKEKLNNLLQLVGIKKPSADAPAVSKRGIQDIFGKIVGEIKEKFESLLEKLNLKPKPAAPATTVSKRDIQEIFGKIVGELKEKFESLLQALNIKPKSKRGIQDIIEKVKAELAHLKEIAKKIQEGASPIDILKDIVKDHPGLKPKLQKVCAIKFLQNIEYVKKACDALNQAEPAAPVADAAVPAPAKRGFGSFLSNIAGNLGPLSGFGKEIDGFKHLVDLIKQKKSPGEIIQAIVDLGLQSKILQLCKLPLLSAVPVVGEACQFIGPLADQITAFTG